ncbi:MAG: hypothetical protein ACREOL_10100 [Candidatus Dormibacteria bacterium]
MTRVTTVRDAEGRVISTSTTRGGCGCGGCATVLLVLFVVALPAEEFPLWGAILAYVAEGIVAVAAIASYLGKWSARRHRSRSR